MNTRYLQSIKGIKTQSTGAMLEGTEVHERLERDFRKDSTPASFDEVVEMSKSEATLTRECFVMSQKYGIRGFIDEIWMTPDEIVIIDDKPGTKAYPSTINQVRAYSLAFKDMTMDKRKIKCCLRERGTDNIFWIEEFDENTEKEIIFTIKRMHSLIDGIKPFMATKNPNKCRSCRYKSLCKKSKL